jgi:hypothetical protein
MSNLSKSLKKSNKSKQRTDKEFDDELNNEINALNKINEKNKNTSYCGLLDTKEGFAILKKMTWVEIEELTDYEFFGE